MKTVSFLSFRTEVPDALKKLIIHTTAKSSINALHSNLAAGFKNYIADVIVPLYHDKSKTKEDVLEMVAYAIGLDISSLKFEPIKKDFKNPLRHLDGEKPVSFQSELESRITEALNLKKKSGSK